MKFASKSGPKKSVSIIPRQIEPENDSAGPPRRKDNLELRLKPKKYHPHIKEKIKAARNIYFSRKPKKEQFYYLYLMILNRRTMNGSLKAVLAYYLRSLFNSCSRGEIKREDRLMDKGIKRLKKDLDIVSLLNLQQEFKEAKSALFDRDDKKLL